MLARMERGDVIEPTLSADQSRALAAIERFARDVRPARPFFVLHGLAGTGKTTLMGVLARKYRAAQLAAFTGKAASVLRSRVGEGARVSTLHSILYDFRGLVEDRREGLRPTFVSKEASLPRRLILVDESSMIGAQLAQELIRTEARIVCCGDPGQLPPVRDQQFFTEPDEELEEIHRQALESPIVRQAHAVRSTGDYEADTDDFRVVPRASPDDLVGHDAILCWRNATRRRLNAKVRWLRGVSGPLRRGEPVMCLRNEHRLGLYNGAVYELARDRDPERDPSGTVLLDGEEVEVDLMTVEGESDFERNRADDDFLPFAPAYAATVHKFQGSEAPSVLLFDEAERDRIPFMYTGMTRAQRRCTVVRWRS